MMKKALCVLLTALLLLTASVQSVFAESSFETENAEWHYRYYYSGYIELCYHRYGTAENVVIPDQIGAVPVSGFCEGNVTLNLRYYSRDNYTTLTLPQLK